MDSWFVALSSAWMKQLVHQALMPLPGSTCALCSSQFSRSLWCPGFRYQMDFLQLCESQGTVCLCCLPTNSFGQMSRNTTNRHWRDSLSYHQQSFFKIFSVMTSKCCWSSSGMWRHLSGSEAAIHAMRHVFKSPKTEAVNPCQYSQYLQLTMPMGSSQKYTSLLIGKTYNHSLMEKLCFPNKAYPKEIHWPWPCMPL